MILIPVLLAAGIGITQPSPANWTGNYAPCDRHADLLSRHHMDLGVRISTSNPALAQQFSMAMDFWRGVVDLQWHEVDSDDCAIEVVDGTPDLFEAAPISARSQLPDLPDFQGWIAFNPRMALSEREMFATCVHEIGHLLGLSHNPDGSSVMYFFDLGGPVSLDRADLEALSARHKLREGSGEMAYSGQSPARAGTRNRPWLRGQARYLGIRHKPQQR